jgi:hypothetical protein
VVGWKFEPRTTHVALITWLNSEGPVDSLPAFCGMFKAGKRATVRNILQSAKLLLLFPPAPFTRHNTLPTLAPVNTKVDASV